MKLGILLAFVLVGLVAFGQPAVAAPPPVTGTISVDQADPHLGDVVTFTYTTSKNDPHLRIQLVCYQGDLDGNGFPDMVYGADQPADTGFLLGSYGSTWLSNGGPATCHANLYSNQSHYQFYAGTDFAAAG